MHDMYNKGPCLNPPGQRYVKPIHEDSRPTTASAMTATTHR